jgi:hypothetical protein
LAEDAHRVYSKELAPALKEYNITRILPAYYKVLFIK